MKNHLYLLLFCGSMAAQNPNDIAARIEAYMQSQVQVHQFSGTVLVTQSDRVVYDKAFGLANREWQIPNSTDAKFPICSLSKQFTAAAVLQLQEQGKLQTSDVLSKYFPDFPKAHQVTLHMLLNHTSGIRECSLDPSWFKIDPNLPVAQLKDSMMVTFKNKPYDFEPGTFWRYSNSGYLLLGWIIEQVAGESYNDYVRKNLLIKARMHDSGSLTHDAIVPKLVNGYSLLTGKWTKAETHSVETFFAAGNIYSTTHDLNLWREALLSGQIISATSLKQMQTPNKEGYGAGYGIFVDRYFNRLALMHSGAISGVNTYMIDYPEPDLRIIILTNRDTNLDFLPKAIAGIALGYEVSPSQLRKRSAEKPELSQFVGNYHADGIPFPINIIEADGKLYWRMHRDIELVPESAHRFFVDEPDVEFQIEYSIGADKKVQQAYVIDGGIKTQMKKT